MLQTPFGLSALTYALIAFTVGSLQDSVLRARLVDPGGDRGRGAASSVSSCTPCSARSWGSPSSASASRRSRSSSGSLNAIAAAPAIRVVRWATGTQGSVRARRCTGERGPVNPDTPRLRLSVLGIIVVSLFAALFARLWYLQVMSGSQFQVAADNNRIRIVAEEAPRGRILDTQRPGHRRQPHLGAGHRRPLGPGQAADSAADRRAHEGRRRAGRCRHPDDRRQARDAHQGPAVQPLRAGADRQRRPRGPQDLDRRAPGRAARRWRRTGWPSGAYPLRPAGRPRRRLRGQGHEGRARRRRSRRSTRPSRTRSTTRSGSTGDREDLRGRPPGHARRAAASRSTPRATRCATLSETPPIPGDDVVLNLNINVQAVAEQALQSGLDHAAHTRTVGSDIAEQGPGRLERGRRPPQRRRAGHGLVPDVQPGGLRRRHQRDRVGRSSRRPANHYPLNNWALQGQYAPGSTFKPFTAASGLAAGLITPYRTVFDTGTYTVPDCTGDSCKFQRTTPASRTASSTCARPSPCRRTSTSTTWAPGSGSTRAATAAPRRSATSSRSGASTTTPASTCPASSPGACPRPRG